MPLDILVPWIFFRTVFVPGILFLILSETRIKVLVISFRAKSLSFTGRYARSISTDRRGRSLTKKLIAVPPFRAKISSL